MFSLNPKYHYSCYSSDSEKDAKNHVHSVNKVYAVEDIKNQKSNLIEYKIRWKVDQLGYFVQWLHPHLLGDVKIFGFNLSGISPHRVNDKIEGIICESEDGNSDFILKNKIFYEYVGSALKSTIKKMITP